MAKLETLFTEYQKRRTALEKARAQRDWLRKQRSEKEAELQEQQNQIQLLDQVALLLREASNFARETGRQILEAMGTNIVQHIWGPDYGMKIEIVEPKNKAPEADIYVTVNDRGIIRKQNPRYANGGSMADMFSIGLRIAMLETHRPKMPGRVLMLDEPTRQISNGNYEAAAAFLKTASQHFKRQMIVVTHDPTIADKADAVFRVVMGPDKISRVTRER